MLDIVLIIIGLPLLLGGAYALVSGSGSLALKLGMAELTVGLTVVAMGTSAPELLVSMFSAFTGATDMAIGNVLGSNLANILLILGVSALIIPLNLEKTIRWREIPFVLLSTLILAVLANDSFFSGTESSVLQRGDGLVLLGYFAVFMYYVFSVAKRNNAHELTETRLFSVPWAIFILFAGIVGLALGGQWLISGATGVASRLGVSEAMIGLTVLALGTSLPELATSMVAALKGNADMAVGNVVGSNVFNILWILGLTASVSPLKFNPALNLDIWFLVAVTLIFFLFTFTGKRHKIDRLEGGIFLTLYISYIAYILVRG